METYGEVVRFCFGPGAELAVEVILATFLFFVSTAYMILMRDINTSLITFLVPPPSDDPYDPAKVLLYTVVLCFPCMLLKSLHSLRYNCYVGFVSVLTLLISIIYRAYSVNTSDPSRLHSGNVLIITESFYDAAFSFPLVALAFLSQFNMLSVHASLKNPTRPRVLQVINGSILTCTLLFLLFGASGYLFALGETKDNIILNFDNDDEVILVGKAGLGVTIMAGVSMIVLPCRSAILSLPRKIRKYVRVSTPKLTPIGERTKLLDRDDTFGYETGMLGGFENKEPGIGADLSDEVDMPETTSKSVDLFVHFTVTALIASSCYLAACFCPGVSTVWSICGSSLGFIIAYILPSACYLKVRQRRKGFNSRVVGAWVMLIVSSLGMVLCTVQATARLFSTGVKTRADEFVEDFYDDDDVGTGEGRFL